RVNPGQWWGKVGPAETKVGGRDVKETRRIHDESPAAAVTSGSRRSQPQKILLRPLVEAAVRCVREGHAIRGVNDTVHRDRIRCEPGRKYRGRNHARGTRVSR